MSRGKIKRSYLIGAFCLALFAAMVWPQILLLMLLQSDTKTVHAIKALRADVLKYTKEHGKPPADLSEIVLPELKIFSRDSRNFRELHRHSRITQVELRPNGGLEALSASTSTYSGVDGKWLYDPLTGAVALGCYGTFTHDGQPWYRY
ncbi:MAG: hypothetical protein PHV36_03165 [Elusimicrobiales bacterium]|nr:hypothetical protein [Elusimicrobiales bacterium]